MLTQLVELLERSRNCAELFRRRGRAARYYFAHGGLEEVSCGDVDQMQARVVVGGRLGCAGGRIAEGAGTSLRELLARAACAAARGQDAHFAFPLPDESGVMNHRMSFYDSDAAELLSPACACEYGLGTLRNFEEMGLTGVELVLRVRVERTAVANTNGLAVEYARTGMRLSVSGRASHRGTHTRAHCAAASSRVIDPIEWGSSLSTGPHLGGLPVKNVRGWRGAVCLGPSAMAAIVSTLLGGLDGTRAVLWSSDPRRRLGTRIASPLLNLIDDGRYASGVRSGPIDDEGVSTRTTQLVTNGVVSGFVLDLSSAAALGMQPTGNAYRDESSVQPAFTTVVVQPGREASSEILQDRHGCLVVDEMGADSQRTMMGGEAVFPVKRGLLYYRDELVGPTEGFLLHGVIREVLEGLVAVGDKTSIVGEIATPAAFFAPGVLHAAE